jgi:hypothetical protein
MGACYSTIYLKLEEEYKQHLIQEISLKSNPRSEVQVQVMQDLLTQGDESNQAMGPQGKDHSSCIKVVSCIDVTHMSAVSGSDFSNEDLEIPEERIEYAAREKFKSERTQTRTDEYAEEYSDENELELDSKIEEFDMLADSYQKEEKNSSLIEMLESKGSKVSELTEELRAYHSRRSCRCSKLDVDTVKKEIQDHAEMILKEQEIPMNYILLNIQTNEAKILSLESKFLTTFNYIRKLKEAKMQSQFRILQAEQSLQQLSAERNQLQAGRADLQYETFSELKNTIKTLEEELDSTKNTLNISKKEVAYLTTKLDEIDAGPYSLFVQEMTKQLLAKEKEMEAIKFECNNIRKEYAEMSLNKEEIEEYLSIVPFQQLKLKELQEKLEYMVSELELTIKSKNDEITHMRLYSEKLERNSDSLSNNIENQFSVMLDLDKHMRNIQQFYLDLQQQLLDLFHSLQTEDICTSTPRSKEQLDMFRHKVMQLEESLSSEIVCISSVTQSLLHKMKQPELFIGLDRDSVSESPISEDEQALKLNQSIEQCEILSPVLEALFSVEKGLEDSSSNSSVEYISILNEAS